MPTDIMTCRTSVRVMDEIVVSPVLERGNKGLEVVLSSHESELILDSTDGILQLSKSKPPQQQQKEKQQLEDSETLSICSHWHPKCGCECSRDARNALR